METQTLEEIKFLSPDLRGYEKYLKNEGYGDEYIGFLTLAPRMLFDLYGSRASIKFLKDPNFRSNFLDIIRSRYQPGTLKKYSSGTRRFREYLTSAGIIDVCPEQKKGTHYITKKTYKYYDENHTPYFRKIEINFGEFISIERAYCKDEIRKKIGAFKKFVSYLIESKIDHFGSIDAETIIQFGLSKTTYKTDWNNLKCFLIYAFREGHISRNFSTVIISKKKNRKTQRKYIESKKKESLLSAVDCSNTLGKRNYAMFLLMAQLALRPCETHRVKYEDLDWVKPAIFDCRWLSQAIDVSQLILGMQLLEYESESKNGKKLRRHAFNPSEVVDIYFGGDGSISGP